MLKLTRSHCSYDINYGNVEAATFVSESENGLPTIFAEELMGMFFGQRRQRSAVNFILMQQISWQLPKSYIGTLF